MRVAQRIAIAAVAAALAAGSGAGQAGAPPKRTADPPVDEKLLEFLGSVDPVSDSATPDGGAWLAYLSRVDIGKAAKAARAPQQPQTPAPPKSADDGKTGR